MTSEAKALLVGFVLEECQRRASDDGWHDVAVIGRDADGRVRWLGHTMPALTRLQVGWMLVTLAWRVMFRRRG